MAAAGITVLKHNVPWGPFTRAQVEEGLARSDFSVENLAHADGLNAWLPLGEVLAYLARQESASKPVLPPLPALKQFPPVVPVPAPPVPPPLRPPILPMTQPETAVARPTVPPTNQAAHMVAPAPEVKPASFFPRGIAFLVDCGILFAPVAILFVIGGLSIEVPALWEHKNQQTMTDEWNLLRLNLWRLSGILAIGCGWLYGAGMEASRSQATVGKRWLGLKVVDAQGARITFLRATGRCAAKYLSALPCFLGFIMALFSTRGLSLHDRLAGTRVVRS